MSALDEQVGGNHYKNMKIQPVQVAYNIGASPLWLFVAKYLTRDKNDKVEDWRKALHCVQLEMEMIKLRCSKYVTEMVKFDHKDIRDFCEQFEDSETLYSILSSMFFGYYDHSVKVLNHCIDNL